MHEKRRRQVKWRKSLDRGTTGAATQLQQDEDKVLPELVEEAEDREVAEDREEEQMVEEEAEEVEKSKAEDVVEVEDSEEEGEAEDSEAKQMVEEGREVGDDEGLDMNEGDGEESEEEEVQQGRVSTKKR